MKEDIAACVAPLFTTNAKLLITAVCYFVTRKYILNEKPQKYPGELFLVRLRIKTRCYLCNKHLLLSLDLLLLPCGHLLQL